MKFVLDTPEERALMAEPLPSDTILVELTWDSGSRTYFGVDPKLDMIYILMEQTRIRVAFKKIVYAAFLRDD